MQKITNSDVEKIALLARLALSPEEIAKFSGQLARILEYINLLSEVPLDDFTPFAGATVNENYLRDDVIGVTLTRQQALQNAPQADENFFQVPAVVK